jgi:YVTN family beta-propeller protein
MSRTRQRAMIAAIALPVAMAAAASAPAAAGTTRALTATGRTATVILVGKNPGGVAADPRTDTIYVTEASDNTVTVISGQTNKVTATIPSFPIGVAANPRTGTIYVTSEPPGGATFRGTVTVIRLCRERAARCPDQRPAVSPWLQ